MPYVPDEWLSLASYYLIIDIIYNILGNDRSSQLYELWMYIGNVYVYVVRKDQLRKQPCEEQSDMFIWLKNEIKVV